MPNAARKLTTMINKIEKATGVFAVLKTKLNTLLVTESIDDGAEATIQEKLDVTRVHIGDVPERLYESENHAGALTDAL